MGPAIVLALQFCTAAVLATSGVGKALTSASFRAALVATGMTYDMIRIAAVVVPLVELVVAVGLVTCMPCLGRRRVGEMVRPEPGREPAVRTRACATVRER